MLSESVLNETMRLACSEARKWLGATSPNPPVGAAALDAAGKLIGLAAHQRVGELHAEATLLDQCRLNGTLSAIDTLCITLESCNHQGKTPPCTEAILKSGIKRVAIGTRDPNPHVRGGGVEFLRVHGVEVIEAIAEDECRQLISSFAYAVGHGRPFVTLKRAFDSKGSMIPPKGHKVFTSDGSLRFAHRLRKKADAILTGSGTILSDNPLFTVRDVPEFPGKRRFLAILDRRRRVPDQYRQEARQRGLDTIIYQDLDGALSDLGRRGVRDVLIEAGVALAQAVLDKGSYNIRVDIHKDDPNDRVETAFNMSGLPFSPTGFQWEFILPS